MSLPRTMNDVLGKITGFQIRRVPKSRRSPLLVGLRLVSPRSAAGLDGQGVPAGSAALVDTFRPPADPKIDRLLVAPVFIMSPVRSGSTLFRVLLGGHSHLHAPHELHVRRLQVGFGNTLADKAMEALGHNRSDLEHLLWDRVLHRELVKSGKQFIVDKTPSNAFAWQRIGACWPDARFIFLLRHPVSIAQSWHEAAPEKRNLEEAMADALRYMKATDRARRGLPGLTVRYEDLTADPNTQLRRVCEYLEVDWEPEMLDYGQSPGRIFQMGLGDWRDKIHTGTVQPGRPLPDPDEVPDGLRELCVEWGYVGKDAEVT